MLSLHKLHPPSALASRLRHRGPRTQPTCRRGFLTGLGTEFLDLALALPIPPSWPAYSTGIILVTLATRFAVLPVSIWSKNKARIVEEVIAPTIAKERSAVEKQVFDQMRLVDKITGDREFLINYHKSKCKEILTARRDELVAQHGCQTWKMMALPPLAQLPPFFLITMVLRQLSESPTVFDSEAFLTLSTLSHPDPTMVLPIVLGLVTMANVETSNLLMTATQKENMKKMEAQKEAMRAAGKVRVIEPGKYLKDALRGLSVVRILLASVMPGSVTLYWLTSATFGLFQTWVMDWADYRRRKALEAGAKMVPQSVPVVPATASRGLGKGPIVRQPTNASPGPRR
ncbi:hypothetical protein D9611_002439 [Ephemerocybe angulata]|uniref:Uncharacterized protein n=1 Tax=Ephemerocybe angulata TaxID=980116 RepID=A0A8H5FE08_9AGAR|nr:hypothetical protein D9611_002439 [Tulosesus angulatus]